MLGVALELGCFLAGLTIGAKGHAIVDRVSWLVGDSDLGLEWSRRHGVFTAGGPSGGTCQGHC